MSPRKISAQQVVEDIEAGMQDTALMVKYDLNPKQLRGLLRRLHKAGLVHFDETGPVEPIGRASVQLTFECPSCGQTELDEFDECPSCGVVVSKFEDSSDEVDSDEEFEPTAYGFSFTAMAIIMALAVVGYFVALWGLRVRADNMLAQQVRSTVGPVARGGARTMNWAKMSNKILYEMTEPGFQSSIGGSELRERLLVIHGEMVRLAQMQRSLGGFTPVTPAGRRDVAGTVDRERLSELLGARLDRAREEDIPEIVDTEWTGFVAEILDGKVPGLKVPVDQISEDRLADEVKDQFEQRLQDSIDRSVRKADKLIKAKKFKEISSAGVETYKFKLSSTMGNLEADGEFDIFELLTDQDEIREQFEAAGLSISEESESARRQMLEARKSVASLCRKFIADFCR